MRVHVAITHVHAGFHGETVIRALIKPVEREWAGLIRLIQDGGCLQ